MEYRNTRSTKRRPHGLWRCGFAGLLVGAGLVVVGASPALAAPSWSITSNPSPAGSPQAQLNGVTCTSTSNCLAVGQQGARSVIERWNGTSWNVSHSPQVPDGLGFLNNALSGVACATASTCFAVGFHQVDANPIALILRWNGSSWSIVNSAVGGALTDVACGSATSCYAVGTNLGHSLVVRWNGTSWTAVPSPNPAGAARTALTGVKCTAPNNCTAVGNYTTTAGATRTLVERGNGASWTIVTSPNPVGVISSRLNSLACPVVSTCFAAGTTIVGGQQRTLIERGNGSAWAIMASPNPVAVPTLSSVACLSATSCFAVGSKGAQTLVERWNGTSWAIVVSPNAAGTQRGLSAVRCIAAATQCFAVGRSDSRTMTERWIGGTWYVQPDPPGGSQSQLTAVACPASAACYAVGSYVAPGPSATHALVEQWDGSSWSIVIPPNPAGASDSHLLGIDCMSTSFCVAVGAATVGAQVLTLVEQWDGAAWTVVTSPNPMGATVNELAGIDCTSTTRCVAVGGASNGQTLVEQWDGAAWTIDSGMVTGRLNDVACDVTDCFAVGSNNNADSAEALVLFWDGASWTPFPGPVPDADFGFFVQATGIACAAADDCVMVGTFDLSGFPESFGAHWDGASWSAVPFPSMEPSTGDPQSGRASDVACTSSSDCTAVGEFVHRSYGHTFVNHWDGSSWSIVSSPNVTNAGESALAGVACTSSTSCIAVGSSTPDAYRRTLIEQYS